MHFSSIPPITDSSIFQNFCNILLNSREPLTVAVDMEFMRETTYWPKLCLLQMATSHNSLPQTILADPLGGLDLNIFKDILAAPHLTKVFHSGRQDLEICWHEWQTLPVNFFDTQVAAMVCSLGEGKGYQTLAHLLLGVEIEKDCQYMNWTRRPLTEQQVLYAQGDVIHLLSIYSALAKETSRLNRWEWMEDELKILLNPLTYQINPQNVWQRIYSSRIKGINLAVLQDICAWREKTALESNINRGHILKDETLLKIATTPIKTEEDIQNLLKGSLRTKPEQPHKIAKEIFALYQSALQKPLSQWPKVAENFTLSDAEKQNLVLFRTKLKEVSSFLGVPERLIAPKSALIDLVKGKIEGNLIFSQWRNEIFGKEIMKLIAIEKKV